jgi:hypothetical protein
MRQGGLANSSGNTLERTIIGTLMSKGFTLIMYREWLKNPTIYGDELLLRNVPYITIYNHPGNTEFLLHSVRYQLKVRIECKWQQSSGSVDEKFPYLYLNCIEQMPERDIIIIVDGGGAKSGSVKWLRDICKAQRYVTAAAEKNISVMNLSEFLIWANSTLR